MTLKNYFSILGRNNTTKQYFLYSLKSKVYCLFSTNKFEFKEIKCVVRIMIKKNLKIKKTEKNYKSYLKIKNSINYSNLGFKIDSEEKLDLLLKSINKFMVERLEAVESDECLTYFLQNMKRYKIMTSIMEAYSLNSGPTYKEEIIKKLRVYSYKTISNIIDDCLARGYIKYVNNYSSNNSEKKIKKFRPSSILITNYINWTLQHVGILNQTLKGIK